MKQRILIIIENAFSFAGTENVCNFMTDCYGPDNEVIILSLKGKGDTFYKFEHVKKIISLEGIGASTYSIIKHVQNINPDYVFVISMGKLSVLYAFLSFFSFKSLNNTFACEHVSYSSFPWYVKLLKIFTLRFYKKVIVLTERDSKKLTSLAIKNLKISNPVHMKNIMRTEKPKIVLAIGRLEYQKGIDRLISIWSLFSKKHPDWILNIAGTGSCEHQVIDQVKKENLEGSIFFLGKVKNVDELYNNAGIYAMTSRYEGLPMVLLEAKSWSLPVVAFDCPTGPREIINHGEDGFLIEDGDIDVFVEKLCLLAEEDDIYFKFCSNIKNTSNQFSIETIKKQWEMLISK